MTILVQTFLEEDHEELKEQFQSLLIFMDSVEKRGLNNEKLGDRIFYMQQQPKDTLGRMNLLENNEQELADRKFRPSEEDFQPSLPKYPIHLRKKTDLKNRKLIGQIRDVLKCRPLLKLTQPYWKIRKVSNIQNYKLI